MFFGVKCLIPCVFTLVVGLLLFVVLCIYEGCLGLFGLCLAVGWCKC